MYDRRRREFDEINRAVRYRSQILPIREAEAENRRFTYRSAAALAALGGTIGYNYFTKKVQNQLRSVEEKQALIDELDIELNANPYSIDFGPQTRPPTVSPVDAPPRHPFTPARTYPEMPKTNRQDEAAAKKARLARAAAYKDTHNPAIRAWMSKSTWKNQYSVPRNAGLHGEVKSVDVTANYQNANLITVPTQAGVLLNGTLTGSAFQNRIGQKIAMNTLFLHMNWYPSPLGATMGGIGRVMVVYDRAPNGAAAILSDVLSSVDKTGTASTNIYSGVNLANRERFRILLDRRFTLPGCNTYNNTAPASIPAAGGNVVTLDFAVPSVQSFLFLNRAETVYSGTLGTVGDIKTGSLLLFYFTDATKLIDTSAAGWYVDYETRLRFTDS